MDVNVGRIQYGIGHSESVFTWRQTSFNLLMILA